VGVSLWAVFSATSESYAGMEEGELADGPEE
jgi:hypothetical protein